MTRIEDDSEDDSETRRMTRRPRVTRSPCDRLLDFIFVVVVARCIIFCKKANLFVKRRVIYPAKEFVFGWICPRRSGAPKAAFADPKSYRYARMN